MATITAFFNKSKSPKTSIQQEPVKIVIPDPVQQKTSTEVSTTPPPACILECCDISSSNPVRLKFDKTSTVREIQKRKRYFQESWLDKHKLWLVLCKTENKAFCQPCRYATHKRLNKQPTTFGIDCFTTEGFTNWRKGAEALSQHEKSVFHKESVQAIQQSLNTKPKGRTDCYWCRSVSWYFCLYIYFVRI